MNDPITPSLLWQKVTRYGIPFYVLFSRPRSRVFLEYKRHKTLDAQNLQKAVNVIAAWARNKRINFVTTTPSSGHSNFAAMVASSIADQAGIEFGRVFKDHALGKRVGLRNKFRLKKAEAIRTVSGKRILVFDDVMETGTRLAVAHRALKRRNQVFGLALSCS